MAKSILYIYGLWQISRLKQPIVTIFGGKRAHKEDVYYQQAFTLAGILAQQGISVLTGGGPGIMEAALCGAYAQEKKGRSLGIGVQGVDVGFKSICGQKTIFLGDFMSRKKLLIDYSCGFIIFPGGIGTADELMEVLNLIKTKKIKSVPVVLIGTKYWKPLLDWFALAIKEHFIEPEHATIFEITDDVQHAINIIKTSMYVS